MIDYLARAMEQEEEERDEDETLLKIKPVDGLSQGADRVRFAEEKAKNPPAPTGAGELERHRGPQAAKRARAAERAGAEAPRAANIAGKVKTGARALRAANIAEMAEAGAREAWAADMVESRGGIHTMEETLSDAFTRVNTAESAANTIPAMSRLVEEAVSRRTAQQTEVDTVGRLMVNGRSLPVEAAVLRRALRQASGISRTPRPAETVPLPLVSTLRRVQAGADFVRRERRNLSVTLPEAPVVAGGLSAEELDRTVERDARRYDGGFSLY